MIKQSLISGRHWKIPPVRCALVGRGGIANERARDHAANAELETGELIRDPADSIELVRWHDALVGGNLKDAVARRVHDQGPGSDLLFTELFQNLGARRRLIPQNKAPSLS